MHKVLVNTHKESNVNILKARDYYFDKARYTNNRWRKVCLLGPIIVSVIGTFLVPILSFGGQELLAQYIERYWETLVGCVAIIAFVIDFFLQDAVGTNLSKSNALREMYDVNVLDLEENGFYYNYTTDDIKLFLQNAKYVQDSDKYEVWYREIFSENDFANAICAMMDNIIYTYYVYTENMKQHFYKLFCIFGVFIVYCFNYAVGFDFFKIVNPFILFLAFFDYVKDVIDSYFISKDLAQKNKELKNIVMNKGIEMLENEQEQKLILRCIQDVIIDNREKGLFISKSVRNKFLDNDSIFYKELDKVKNLFWGKNVVMPQYAKDFEISAVEDENKLVNLESIHKELTKMLEDVKNCLDRNKYSFLLDGGTLIGSCRDGNNAGFLQWDDDIDIAVKSSEVESIIQVLTKELGEKYDIQTYYNEESYSPRLSTFRIRQKNDVSKVCEKDSELFELYKSRGLFIDVYAYTPILGAKWMDATYRRMLIHPLNKKIRKVEADWKYGKNPEKALHRFKILKRKYINRAKWYLKHAKNEKYVAYEPFYIYDLKNAGPYIKSEDIYGTEAKGKFEGQEYEIPSNSDAVLKSFYGDDWETSPFLSIPELIEKGELIYSKATFDASCYKHLKKVSVYGEK